VPFIHEEHSSVLHDIPFEHRSLITTHLFICVSLSLLVSPIVNHCLSKLAATSVFWTENAHLLHPSLRAKKISAKEKIIHNRNHNLDMVFVDCCVTSQQRVYFCVRDILEGQEPVLNPCRMWSCGWR